MAKTVTPIPLLTNSPGSTRQLIAHRYGKPGWRPKAYLQAAIHADEIPPLLVAHHLIRLLDEAERAGQIKGEIIVVPLANPIGSGQFLNTTHVGRYELSGGGNFNRNWPDLSAGLAERVRDKLTGDGARNVAIVREALLADLNERTAGNEMTSLRLALARLAVDADFVFDMHCDSDSLLHLFLSTAHWPEGADLSAEIGSHATLLCEDSGGHSFDETFSLPWVKLAAACPGRPIPPACLAATIEYRGQADVFDAMAEPDAQALFRFLQRRGLIAGNPGPAPKPLCDGTLLDATDSVRSPGAGVLAYKVELGQRVTAGTDIAELVDPMADDPAKARMPIKTITDGLVLSRRLDKLVRPGDSVAKVVGNRSLPSRKGYLLED
jgi:predicted deacylase